MKINAGAYKYRKLEIPKGIRPTTEKVREAVFSMLSVKIPDAVVLDLFAGSGSLGLEALSRGAAHCYFNEGDRRIFRVLQENVQHCGAEEKSSLMNGDFRTVMKRIPAPVDIVFLDPPYRENFYGQALALLEEHGLLAEGSVVVAEHLYDNPLDDNYGSLVKIKGKKYGTIAIDVFSRC